MNSHTPKIDSDNYPSLLSIRMRLATRQKNEDLFSELWDEFLQNITFIPKNKRNIFILHYLEWYPFDTDQEYREFGQELALLDEAKDYEKNLKSFQQKHLAANRILAFITRKEFDDSDYKTLKDDFIKSYKEDKEGSELILKIEKAEALALGENKKVFQVADKFEAIGYDFHAVEARVEGHLRLTNFTDDQQREQAKIDIFRSIDILESHLGEGLGRIFSNMIDAVDFNKQIFTIQISKLIDFKKLKELSGIEKFRGTKNIADLALLIELVYSEYGNPIEVLGKALDEKNRYYRQQEEELYAFCQMNVDGMVPSLTQVESNICKNLNLKTITRYSVSDIKAWAPKGFGNIKCHVAKLVVENGGDYILETKDEQIAGFIENGEVVVIRKKGAPLLPKSSLQFLKSKLFHHEDKDLLSVGTMDSIKFVDDMPPYEKDLFSNYYAIHLRLPTAAHADKWLTIKSKNILLSCSAFAEMSDSSGPAIMGGWKKGELETFLNEEYSLPIEQFCEIGSLAPHPALKGEKKEDLIILQFYMIAQKILDLKNSNEEPYKLAAMITHPLLIRWLKRFKMDFKKIESANPITIEERQKRAEEEIYMSSAKFEIWKKYIKMKTSIYICDPQQVETVLEEKAISIMKKYKISNPFS